MLNRILSHIHGRWYLPMFLLRNGVLTLMYSASFIALLSHKNKIRGGHSNIHEKQDGHSNIQDKQGDHTVPSINKDKKWVINVSSTPLTEVQGKLLAHGPNYAVVPRHPHIIEVVTAVEQICQKLVKGKAEEL